MSNGDIQPAAGSLLGVTLEAQSSEEIVVEFKRADEESLEREDGLHAGESTLTVLSKPPSRLKRTLSISPPDHLYQPAPPLGFWWLEQTWRVGTLLDIPLMIHASVPIYVALELLWAVCHWQEAGWYLLHTLLLVLFQAIALAVHVYATVWCTIKMKGRIHTAIVWPYGIMGYGYSFKDWSHLLLALFIGPLTHFIWILVFIPMAAAIGNQQWELVSPMRKHFAINLLNGVWIVNVDLMAFHCVVPIYSMKVARLVATMLSSKLHYHKVASILQFPSAFMVLLLAIYAYSDDYRIIGFFLSFWSAYQTYLLWDSQRRALVHKLPIFQLVQNRLRAESERRRREHRRQSSEPKRHSDKRRHSDKHKRRHSDKVRHSDKRRHKRSRSGKRRHSDKRRRSDKDQQTDDVTIGTVPNTDKEHGIEMHVSDMLQNAMSEEQTTAALGTGTAEDRGKEDSHPMGSAQALVQEQEEDAVVEDIGAVVVEVKEEEDRDEEEQVGVRHEHVEERQPLDASSESGPSENDGLLLAEEMVSSSSSPSSSGSTESKSSTAERRAEDATITSVVDVVVASDTADDSGDLLQTGEQKKEGSLPISASSSSSSSSSAVVAVTSDETSASSSFEKVETAAVMAMDSSTSTPDFLAAAATDTVASETSSSAFVEVEAEDIEDGTERGT